MACRHQQTSTATEENEKQKEDKEKAIEEYLERNSWQIAELKSAEKEIVEGKFISHNEVEDYLNSWSETNPNK